MKTEILIRPSEYLDENNWESTFPKFIEMCGKADEQQEREDRGEIKIIRLKNKHKVFNNI